jgi:hypothetical protein
MVHLRKNKDEDNNNNNDDHGMKTTKIWKRN